MPKGLGKFCQSPKFKHQLYSPWPAILFSCVQKPKGGTFCSIRRLKIIFKKFQIEVHNPFFEEFGLNQPSFHLIWSRQSFDWIDVTPILTKSEITAQDVMPLPLFPARPGFSL